MSAKEIYGYGRKYKDVIRKQEYDLVNQEKELLAKEMFEKLGYKLKVDCNGYIQYYNTDEDIYVWFDKIQVDIEITQSFKPTLLQAINKQIEELGWN